MAQRGEGAKKRGAKKGAPKRKVSATKGRARGGVRWREGHVIGVPLKGGVEVLAQMIRAPYLVFFESFTRPGEWPSVRLSETPVLFVCAVVRSFMWCAERRDLEPATNLVLPKRWIHTFPGSRWK